MAPKKQTRRDADVVRGSDYRMLQGQAQVLREELDREREAITRIAQSNVTLRAQNTDYKREIDKLLREQVDLRDRLNAADKLLRDRPTPEPGILTLLKRKCERLSGELGLAQDRAHEHIRDINKLLQEKAILQNDWNAVLNEKNRLLAENTALRRQCKRLAWNGDSGDLVDFERKLCALLGDEDAVKYLRHMVTKEKHRFTA